MSRHTHDSEPPAPFPSWVISSGLPQPVLLVRCVTDALLIAIKHWPWGQAFTELLCKERKVWSTCRTKAPTCALQEAPQSSDRQFKQARACPPARNQDETKTQRSATAWTEDPGLPGKVDASPSDHRVQWDSTMISEGWALLAGQGRTKVLPPG